MDWERMYGIPLYSTEARLRSEAQEAQKTLFAWPTLRNYHAYGRALKFWAEETGNRKALSRALWLLDLKQVPSRDTWIFEPTEGETSPGSSE